MKAEEQITAYKSLRDAGQAFFVDTYEDCNRIIGALEKQMPKKPNFEGDGYDDSGNIIYDIWICPCCGDRYEVDYERHNHCPTCGRR